MKKITEIAKERIVFCTNYLEILENNKKENIEKKWGFLEEDFNKQEIAFSEAKKDWEKLLGHIESNKLNEDFKRVFNKTIVSMLDYHLKDNAFLVKNKEFSDKHPQFLITSQKTLDDLKEAFNESFRIWEEGNKNSE